MKRFSNFKKGFTLVELVIVIAVLAILAAIAVPTMTNVINSANENTDKSNAQTIELALKSAYAEAASGTWDISALKDSPTIDKVTVDDALKHEGLNGIGSIAVKEGNGCKYVYDSNGHVSCAKTSDSLSEVASGSYVKTVIDA